MKHLEPVVKALFLATEKGNLEDVECFVGALKKSGLKRPDFRDGEGYTLLHVAAIHGHLHIVQYFLSHHKLDPNQTNSKKMTPFLYACRLGHSALAVWMLEHKHASFSEKDEDGWNGLFYAITCDQLKTVKALLDHAEKKRLPALENADKHERNPLAIAIRAKNWGIVQYLLEDKKMGLFQKNKTGRTPLDEALAIECLDEMLNALPRYRKLILDHLKKEASSSPKMSSYDVHRAQEQTKSDVARYQRLEWLTHQTGAHHKLDKSNKTEKTDKRHRKHKHSLFNKEIEKKLDKAKNLVDLETAEKYPQLEKFYKDRE